MTPKLLLVGLVLLLTLPKASAGDPEIEHSCTTQYPNIWQTFAWNDCVKRAEEKQTQERIKRLRDERVRPCIAADISRMEELAAKASSAVHADFSLEQAKAALNPILGREESIEVAKDNIKERVLVYSIETKCDSSFYLLINIQAAEDGTLRWFRTYAKDAPQGYPGNYHKKYSVEFDDERQKAIDRAKWERERELDRRMQQEAIARARESMEKLDPERMEERNRLLKPR